MRKIIIALFSLAFFAYPLTSACSAQTDSLSSLVGDANARELASRGEISRYLDSSATLALYPARPERGAIIESIKAMNPTIGVEILKLMPMPGIAKTDSASMLRIYNSLRALGTLKGIEYYSASRKRMRIFYEDAYIIDNRTDKKRIADAKASAVEAKSNLLCFFKDSSFGEYVCSIDYSADAASIFMDMQNLTEIWYLFVKIIEPKNMKSRIVVIPVEDGILFYGLSAVRGDDPFGIAKSKSDSLYNRLIALYNWFDSRMRQ